MIKNQKIILTKVFTLLFFSLIISCQSNQTQFNNNTLALQQYNETLAKQFWDFCIISYCNITYIQNWNCGKLCDQYYYVQDVQIIKSSDSTVLAYIFYNSVENKVTLVFRGSDNTLNWINNIDIILADYDYCSGCKVHLGFYLTYLEIQNQLLIYVKQYLNDHNQLNIEITGHSLGAALAAYFVADVTYKNVNLNIIQYYTFGSPRLGNDQFANWFDSIFYNYKIQTQPQRIVHYHDVVPKLPPILFGYLHINTEVWYSNEDSTQYQVCLNTEDPSCSDSVLLINALAKDHNSYMGKVLEGATSPCY